MSAVRNAFVIGTSAVMLCACTSEPPLPPAGPVPDTQTATRAYLAAMRADFLGPTPTGLHDDLPEHLRGAAAGIVDEEADREVARRQLIDFLRLKISDCEWRRYEKVEVAARAQLRVPAGLEAGHFCRVTVYLNNSARGQLSGEGAGYFFTNGGRIDFAGEFAHGWTPVG